MNLLNQSRVFFLLILFSLAISFTSCYKEPINTAPRLVDYSITPLHPKAGDEVSITINSSDMEDDELFYKWNLNTGTATSKNTDKTFTCKVPYIEGDFCYELEISDKKAITDHDICINIDGYVYEDFSNPDSIWSTEKGISILEEEHVSISPEGLNEGIYSFAFPEKINPPYVVYMSVAKSQASADLNSADKYGLLLDFFNVGTDTLAKALWFRIYPNSNVKNWKVSLYKDVGSTGSWQNLDSTAIGKSEFVKTDLDLYNHIKMEVLEDNTINVYVEEQLIFTTTSLSSNYLTDGNAPKLILDKVAARISGGSMKIDNVYVTKKMNLNFNDIFQY